MREIRTRNLLIRDFTLEDDDFVLQLLNDPTYIKNIRDNNVRTLEDARRYIQEKIFVAIDFNGFGYHLISRISDKKPLGMCGLMQRTFLKEPDLGFAFLFEHQRLGHGFEAVLAYLTSDEVTPYSKLHAFTSLENPGSQSLLRKLGFYDCGVIQYEQTGEDVRLFTLNRAV